MQLSARPREQLLKANAFADLVVLGVFIGEKKHLIQKIPSIYIYILNLTHLFIAFGDSFFFHNLMGNISQF